MDMCNQSEHAAWTTGAACMVDAKQRDEGAKRGIELMHARLESSITGAACR